MKNIIAAAVAFGMLSGPSAFAQTKPTVNLAPVIVDQQLQANRQQMSEQTRANALTTTQQQTRMNQAVSGMAQQNQKVLNSQVPPKLTPLKTGNQN